MRIVVSDTPNCSAIFFRFVPLDKRATISRSRADKLSILVLSESRIALDDAVARRLANAEVTYRQRLSRRPRSRVEYVLHSSAEIPVSTMALASQEAEKFLEEIGS